MASLTEVASRQWLNKRIIAVRMPTVLQPISRLAPRSHSGSFSHRTLAL